MLFEINTEYPSAFCNGCPKHCYINSSTDIPTMTSRASINYTTVFSIKHNSKIIYPVFRAPHLARKFAWQIAKHCAENQRNKNR